MKVYTKTGDKGTTSLWGGSRVSKASLEMKAIGEVDELNAYLGLMRDYTINAPHKEFLIFVQHKVFDLGAVLAADPKRNMKKTVVTPEDVDAIEQQIDQMDAELEPIKQFVLPGGHKEVSFAHIARAVCRRAERAIVELQDVKEIPEEVLKFINRLSDYLFVLSRWMTKAMDVVETPWQPTKEK